MKYFVKFIVVTFFSLLCTYSFAEQKIVILDMKVVLNNSKAGKGAQDYLQKTFKDNQKKFSDTEKALKKEENELLEKKTIFTPEEYSKRSDELRVKVVKYQNERRASLEKITAMRAEARKKLLEKVDPILNDYIKENNISLVMDKKNVLGGNPSIDITNIVIEKLNKELPKINLK